MKNPYAVVTVRTSSTRLPNKCLMTIVDDITCIQIVIRRAKKVGCPVVLATSDDTSDNQLERLANVEGVECFRGALKNKIRRWADCFSAYGITEGLLVDGDDLTFDFNIGRRALRLLQEGGADMVIPSNEMILGFFTYAITRTGIEKLLLTVPDRDTDTDVITEFINRAGLTKSIIPAERDETLGHKVRLTVDYTEDIQFYRALYEKIDYLAPGPEIVRVALDNKLNEINWHMQEAFLENQQRFNERVRAHG